MRRAIIAVGLGLALVGGGLWWQHHPAHPAPVNASLYENDMTEALMRGVLRDLPAPVPPVCFLAFGDGSTSPSREFVARFAGSQPAVRSCGSAVSPPIGKYFETSTGKPGLIIHIINFREYATGTFDVAVAFSNLPSGRDHFTYRICNNGGDWIIKNRKPM